MFPYDDVIMLLVIHAVISDFNVDKGIHKSIPVSALKGLRQLDLSVDKI